MNGGLGLLLALIVPLLATATSGLGPVAGGLVMTYLVLANGATLAAIQAALAALSLGLLAVVLGEPVGQIVGTATVIWVPAFLLAAFTRRMRSLTLTLQVSVILAMIAVLGFFIVLGDPADYWREQLSTWSELVRSGGQPEYADQLLLSKDLIVQQLTMMAVFAIWMWLVLILLLGYGLFQSLPNKDAIYGRFADLNLGRVLAGVMAVTSLMALAVGVTWLQNLAFVAFVVFWLQGLAIMHWLHAEKLLPLFVLIATYVFLAVPVLNGLLILALAVFGYMDAWFNFRARRTARL